MPENTNLAKELIASALEDKTKMKPLTLHNAHKKEFKKLKYYTVEHNIQETSKRPVGRPSQKQSISCSRIEYQLQFTLWCQEDKIQKAIDQASTFVLVSTDTKLEAEEILKEYKTQRSVEKNFNT